MVCSTAPLALRTTTCPVGWYALGLVDCTTTLIWTGWPTADVFGVEMVVIVPTCVIDAAGMIDGGRAVGQAEGRRADGLRGPQEGEEPVDEGTGRRQLGDAVDGRDDGAGGLPREVRCDVGHGDRLLHADGTAEPGHLRLRRSTGQADACDADRGHGRDADEVAAEAAH